MNSTIAVNNKRLLSFDLVLNLDRTLASLHPQIKQLGGPRQEFWDTPEEKLYY